ncbi:MAG: sugar ABC transporter permease [Herpetosiphon sp.]
MHRSAQEKHESLLFALMVAPNLLLFCIFTFWPLVYNAYLSFVQWDMLSPVKLWVGVDNYRSVMADRQFLRIFFNTFYFTGVSVVLVLVLGLAAALVLVQPLRWRKSVRAVLFAPTILSGAAIGIVWIYIFDPRFGLISEVLRWFGLHSPDWLSSPGWAMPAIIIVYVWKNVGYTVVIFIAGLLAIPADLYEAARVDGANGWQRFLNVTLPGLSPVLFFLILTGVLTSFQAFDIIKTMTNGGPVDATNTLVFYLYQQGFIGFNAGNAGVAAVILFLLMLAFTVVQLRYAERRVTYA